MNNSLRKSKYAMPADRGSWHRLGSLPGCVALDCADIGTARVGGKQVYITWGRNISLENQEYYARCTYYELISLADPSVAELVFPDHIAKKLLPLVEA